jgi:hypothetical protein
VGSAAAVVVETDELDSVAKRARWRAGCACGSVVREEDVALITELGDGQAEGATVHRDPVVVVQTGVPVRRAHRELILVSPRQQTVGSHEEAGEREARGQKDPDEATAEGASRQVQHAL